MHGMFDEVAYSSMFCSVLTHGAHAQRGSCVSAYFRATGNEADDDRYNKRYGEFS